MRLERAHAFARQLGTLTVQLRVTITVTPPTRKDRHPHARPRPDTPRDPSPPARSCGTRSTSSAGRWRRSPRAEANRTMPIAQRPWRARLALRARPRARVRARVGPRAHAGFGAAAPAAQTPAGSAAARCADRAGRDQGRGPGRAKGRQRDDGRRDRGRHRARARDGQHHPLKARDAPARSPRPRAATSCQRESDAPAVEGAGEAGTPD